MAKGVPLPGAAAPCIVADQRVRVTRLGKGNRGLRLGVGITFCQKEMKPELTDGDLLDQDVDVIVNAWNRNLIPWWLLLPQGVSGAIKRRAGVGPFRELARRGPIPLGGAALTGAGRLPYKGIIHVAGINMLWRASRESIVMSVCSAMGLVRQNRFQSVAFPVIGAGSGGFNADEALQIMVSVFAEMNDDAKTIIVKFRKRGQS